MAGFLKWVLFIVAVVLLALVIINRVKFLRDIAGQGLAAGVAPEGLGAKIPGSGAATAAA